MIKKFKVFISGNQKELKKERFAVKEVILGNTIYFSLGRILLTIFLKVRYELVDLEASHVPSLSIQRK